MEQRRVGDAGV